MMKTTGTHRLTGQKHNITPVILDGLLSYFVNFNDQKQVYLISELRLHGFVLGSYLGSAQRAVVSHYIGMT